MDKHGMDPQQQYCLKWNSYSSNLASSFSNLFKSESLTDVTLLCGDTIFKAHKLILAACSKKFHDLFGTAPSNGSNVCVILEATTADNMSALLEFMYKGEVHVSQESLSSFLKAAECLQVKGLSIEHGRLTAHSHGTGQEPPGPIETPPQERRQQRNCLSNVMSQSAALKQECDSLMQHATSSGIGGFPSYLPHMYRPSLNFDPPRKRHLRSPFTEQEQRDSVLRDGSKASTGSASPINKGYRPASSASTVAPSEADTMQTERVSPQQSRYENHSPPSTTAGNGSILSSLKQERHDRIERNGGNELGDEREKDRDLNDGGAEDLRIKMETDFSPPTRPTSNTTAAPQTPTTPVGFPQENSIDGAAISGNLPSPAEMLNVWPASKLANKGGSVNTADGKKLRCPLCDRLYGYETNLRAHIRQRHQGIRVPCPFCTRTFTRNNTVRRHIAREHKNELNKQYENSQLPPNQQQPSHTL